LRFRFTPSQLDVARIEQMQKDSFTVKLFARMNHDLVDIDTGTFPTDLFPGVFTWAGARMHR
jgi:hypothetical protein